MAVNATEPAMKTTDASSNVRRSQVRSTTLLNRKAVAPNLPGSKTGSRTRGPRTIVGSPQIPGPLTVAGGTASRRAPRSHAPFTCGAQREQQAVLLRTTPVDFPVQAVGTKIRGCPGRLTEHPAGSHNRHHEHFHAAHTDLPKSFDSNRTCGAPCSREAEIVLRLSPGAGPHAERGLSPSPILVPAID